MKSYEGNHSKVRRDKTGRVTRAVSKVSEGMLGHTGTPAPDAARKC